MERDEAYRNLTDAIVDPTWVFDLIEGKLTYIHGRTHDLCGCSASEMLGHGPERLLPDMVAFFKRVLPGRLEAFFRGDDTAHVDEILVATRDGSRAWTESRTKLAVDPGSGNLVIAGATRPIAVVSQRSEVTPRNSTPARPDATEQGLFLEMQRIAKIGAWSFDPATGAGRWTDEVDRIHDVPSSFEPTASLGLGFFEEPYRATIEEALRAAIEEGTPYDLELELTSAKGVKKWVRTIAWPVIEHGKVVRMRGTIQDITERKRIELDLVQERALLQAVIHTIPDLVFVKDLEGKYLACNAHFELLYGVKRADLLGRNDYDFVPKDLADFFRGKDRAALAAGVPTKNEELLRFSDGHEELTEMIKTPIKGPEGETLGVLGVGRDVTALRAAIDAQRASEERYRELVDSLDDVVFTTDMDGRLVFVNRAIKNFGYDPETVIGRKLDELIHLDDYRSIMVGGASIDRGEPVEVRLRDAKGEYRTQRARLRKLVVNDQTIGQMGIFADLTVLRETEQQLRAAQKMEAIGRLAGGVAHDFNNLLTVILSSADVALDAIEQGDPLREDITQITSAARRAEGLTQQLLAFSRRQVMQKESFRLNAVVDNLADMLRRLIGEDIDLRIRTFPVAPTTLDRSQIEQVIMNLVVNARDAMPQGGVLTLSTKNVSLDWSQARSLELAPGPYVTLTIEDTGVGMDKTTLARVFEPFFTTKGPGNGTGLGLSMVYGIIKQSGGGISVESTLGHGARFRIYLPQSVSENTKARPKKARSPSGLSSSLIPFSLDEASPKPRVLPCGGSERILVVEDEDRLRTVVKRILKAAGYDVLTAANAEEALSVVATSNESIDLVVSDVVMPGMSGSDLVARLTKERPHMKVVFTSGYTDEKIARFGVGNHRFLPKPFRATELTECVREALDDETPRSVQV